MNDVFSQLFMGLSAVFYAPTGCLPNPRTLITLPPTTATQGIAYDFYRISGDFNRAIDKVQNETQLEMDLKSERRAA